MRSKRSKVKRTIRLMEVCGTHTMAIARHGIRGALPSGVELISGPGCPVCVTPVEDIDRAIAVSAQPGVILTTFGDMMRVPGTEGSLALSRSKGADVRVVYSCLDALKIAGKYPDRKVVFAGVGFETTSPTVAATVLEAERLKIKNFYVLPFFKLVMPALNALVNMPDVRVDGFICPGHVSVITGVRPYRGFAARNKKPCVVTGFEPADLVNGIKMLIDMVKAGDFSVRTEYSRAVSESGNPRAQEIMKKVFAVKDSSWRGIGIIKKSGFGFIRRFLKYDANKAIKVGLPRPKSKSPCVCGEILTGVKIPEECRLFGKVCTPEAPVGPCMVSTEGTCAARYKYGR